MTNSRKNYKNTNKPREMAVIYDINAGDIPRLTYDNKTQIAKIKFYRDNRSVKPKKITNIVYFKRDNGKPKILSKVEFRDPATHTLCDKTHIASFNHVWAIDTNKKIIGGKQINAASIIVVNTNNVNDTYPVMSTFSEKQLSTLNC